MQLSYQRCSVQCGTETAKKQLRRNVEATLFCLMLLANKPCADDLLCNNNKRISACTFLEFMSACQRSNKCLIRLKKGRMAICCGFSFYKALIKIASISSLTVLSIFMNLSSLFPSSGCLL